MISFREWLSEATTATLPSRYVQSGMVTLYHYTDLRPDQKETVLLDPRLASLSKHRHMYSRREWEVVGTPRLFFYVNKNDVFKDHGPLTHGFLYKVEFPIEYIYPSDKDPLGLQDKATIKQKYMISSMFSHDKYLRLIKQAGYKGIYYKTNFPTVSLFVPVRAKLLKAPAAWSGPEAV